MPRCWNAAVVVPCVGQAAEGRAGLAQPERAAAPGGRLLVRRAAAALAALGATPGQQALQREPPQGPGQQAARCPEDGPRLLCLEAGLRQGLPDAGQELVPGADPGVLAAAGVALQLLQELLAGGDAQRGEGIDQQLHEALLATSAQDTPVQVLHRDDAADDLLNRLRGGGATGGGRHGRRPAVAGPPTGAVRRRQVGAGSAGAANVAAGTAAPGLPLQRRRDA
mmetsp:Transcript_88536/g.275372  ORF Transcript_88536/g.275372 Transcript_88536/m.275372 type:complete len:224 (-) Transcript_88536:511-1182(-)